MSNIILLLSIFVLIGLYVGADAECPGGWCHPYQGYGCCEGHVCNTYWLQGTCITKEAAWAWQVIEGTVGK